MYGPYGVLLEFMTVIICTLFNPKATISGGPSVSALGVLEYVRVHDLRCNSCDFAGFLLQLRGLSREIRVWKRILGESKPPEV